MQVCVERLSASRTLLFVIGELHWADEVVLDLFGFFAP